jgi:hypothetical protein
MSSLCRTIPKDIHAFDTPITPSITANQAAVYRAALATHQPAFIHWLTTSSKNIR